MESDLKALHTKLTELISISRALKVQNATLQQQLQQSQSEVQHTTKQMQLAGAKIEALIASLPDKLAEPVLQRMAEDLED